MGLTGCDNIGYKPFETTTIEMPPTDEEYVENVVSGAFDYLNRNYDDEFTLVKVNYPVWVSSSYRLEFSSKKYNGWKFDVVYECREVGQYTDGYFKAQMNGEAEEFFGNILKECGIDGVVKLEINGGARPEWLSATATFDEYLRGGHISLSLGVFSEPKLSHEQQMRFVNRIIAFYGEYDVTWREEKRSVPVSVDFIVSVLGLDEIKSRASLDDVATMREGTSPSVKSYVIYSDLEIEEYEERNW